MNCVRFRFGAVCDLFVCVWNISGTAERICAKLTEKTWLVPRSDEFEGQGQRSKVNITTDKKAGFSADNLGTAERIWSLAGSDEFESQGQKSKIKVTRDKNGIFELSSYVWIWRKSVQRFRRYFIHKQKHRRRQKQNLPQFTACRKNFGCLCTEKGS